MSVLNPKNEFAPDVKFQAKIELWKQMQQMVMDVEGRNFSGFGFSSVVSVVTAIIAEYNEKFSYFVLVIPIIMLFGIFMISFNNRTSAILRGYFIIFAALDIYSFCKLFTLLNISCWIHIVLFILYIVIVLFFSISFAIDLATNGEIKILSRIYFHKHNEMVNLEKLKQTDPDDINDDRIAIVDSIIPKTGGKTTCFIRRTKQKSFPKSFSKIPQANTAELRSGLGTANLKNRNCSDRSKYSSKWASAVSICMFVPVWLRPTSAMNLWTL